MCSLKITCGSGDHGLSRSCKCICIYLYIYALVTEVRLLKQVLHKLTYCMSQCPLKRCYRLRSPACHAPRRVVSRCVCTLHAGFVLFFHEKLLSVKQNKKKLAVICELPLLPKWECFFFFYYLYFWRAAANVKGNAAVALFV